MHIAKDFAFGIFSVLKIMGAPLLYRYPYRHSGEAFRSDWQNIANDIESVMGNINRDSQHD